MAAGAVNLASAAACMIESTAVDGSSPWPCTAAEEVNMMSSSAQGDLFPAELGMKWESALTPSSTGQISGLVKSGSPFQLFSER